MSDLFTATRAHDLPPKWDGRAVLWEGWRDELDVRICPPPRERSVCTNCGSLTHPVVNRGLLAHRRKATIGQIEGHLRGGKPGRVAYWSLFVRRCPDCKHDVVWDWRKDETWDLDFTDYGDDGSADPDGRW